MSYRCPICSKPLRISQEGNLYCSGYKDGCSFGVNKRIAGKTLTQTQLLMLASSGRTNIIRGFTAKNGNLFDAALSIDKETGKLKFLFANGK